MRFFKRGPAGPPQPSGLVADRLRFSHRDGHTPWLVADRGTERAVRQEADPLDAVHAVVSDLARGLTVSIAPSSARIAAEQFSVFVPNPPTACDSRGDAIAAVSRSIARVLARGHENGSDYLASTVALFGGGCGILLQQTFAQSGDWRSQECFLIDTDNGVHHYFSYSR